MTGRLWRSLGRWGVRFPGLGYRGRLMILLMLLHDNGCLFFFCFCGNRASELWVALGVKDDLIAKILVGLWIGSDIAWYRIREHRRGLERVL